MGLIHLQIPGWKRDQVAKNRRKQMKAEVHDKAVRPLVLRGLSHTRKASTILGC